MNRIFVLLLLAYCVLIVEPIRYGNKRMPERNLSPLQSSPAARILKQFHYVYEDGSYIFGFESSDGTFRVEHRNVNGAVRGKYGYIDETNRFQVSDYSAGVSTPERFDHFKSKKLASSINSNVEDNSLSSRFDVDRSSKETRVLEDEFTPSYEVEKPQVPYQRNLPNNEEHVQYQRPKFFKFGQSIFRYPSVTP